MKTIGSRSIKNSTNSFIKYVSLSIFSMVGVSAYFLADTFFIANGVGILGLTALNLALPIFGVVNGLGLMFGMGCATKYKLYKSQGQNKEANSCVTVGLIMEAIFSLVIVLVGVFAAEGLSKALGADESTLQLTMDYLKTILIGAPLFMFNHFFICLTRNDGMPSISMIAMMLSNLTNIVLDYVFIYPLKMSMFGAALATVISPIVSTIFLLISLAFRKNHYGLGKPKLEFKTPLHIAKLGVPSLIGELSSGIVCLLFNMLILPISGNIGVAAYGVIANVSLVCFAIFTGISQGIQPIISHAQGSGNRSLIRKTYLKGVTLALALALAMYIFLVTMDDWVISVFNKDGNEQLISIAKEGILLYFLALFVSGVNYVTIALFSSVDKPKQAVCISLMRGIVAIVPTVFLMSYLLKMKGIWLSLMIAELITLVITVITVIIYLRKSVCSNDNPTE